MFVLICWKLARQSRGYHLGIIILGYRQLGSPHVQSPWQVYEGYTNDKHEKYISSKKQSWYQGLGSVPFQGTPGISQTVGFVLEAHLPSAALLAWHWPRAAFKE